MSSLRSRAIAAAKKRDGLRSRLIFWRKRGKRAKKLRKSYLRAVVDARRLKRQLKAERKRTLGDKALTEARTFIGIMERGGNNNGPEVLRIIKANGGVGPEPWCGDFVAWCYRVAGSKAVTRSWAAVRLLRVAAGVHKTSRPRPGDIVIFTFDHTGILEKVMADGRYQVVEGNTGASGAVSDSKTGGDGVYRKRRDPSLVREVLRVTR